MVTCPHCSQEMNDAPELAGQFVACPHCGQQFPLPPSAPRPVWRDPPTPLPVATPVIRPATQSPQPSSPPDPPSSPRDEFAFDTGSTVSHGRRTSIRDRVADEYRRAKRRPTKLPKFFLLAATIIWPIAAAGWGQVRYSWAIAERPKIEPAEAIGLVLENRGRSGGDIYQIRADSARWTGMQHVTIIYAVAAIGCLAWWFYVKD